MAFQHRKDVLLSYIKNDVDRCESKHEIYITTSIEPHQYFSVTDDELVKLIAKFNYHHNEMCISKRKDPDTWDNVYLSLECWGKGNVNGMKIMVVLVRAYEDDRKLLHVPVDVFNDTLDQVLSLFASCEVYDKNGVEI